MRIKCNRCLGARRRQPSDDERRSAFDLTRSRRRRRPNTPRTASSFFRFWGGPEGTTGADKRGRIQRRCCARYSLGRRGGAWGADSGGGEASADNRRGARQKGGRFLLTVIVLLPLASPQEGGGPVAEKGRFQSGGFRFPDNCFSSPPNKDTPKDKISTTQHTVSIGGQTISYTARAGTMIMRDEEGKPRASFFFTSYTKDGADPSRRPVTFTFNGGPGSSSVWLHMGAFGPKRVVYRDDEGHAASRPIVSSTTRTRCSTSPTSCSSIR